ncbi:MAG: hypothetical protein AAFR97_08550, partial [Bacteroidota bacterium]
LFLSNLTLNGQVAPSCAISSTGVEVVTCDPANQDDAIINVFFDVVGGSGDYNLVDADTDEVLGSITGAATTGTAVEINGTVSGPTTAGETVNVKVVDAQTGLPIELTTNGDFEAGDVSSWTPPTPLLPGQVFEATSMNPSSGNFAGRLFNPVQTNGAVIKQANIGVGVVNPGDEITVTFDARGLGEAGGVGIAEFFSELAGGGVSSSTLLGGAPFSIDPSFNFDTWTTFTYTVIAGSDVSGGVTLQFVAATGAEQGSVMNLFIDNVSVTVNGESCMGGAQVATLPECVSSACVVSNTSIPATECITNSQDDFNITVAFDVTNGSGSYELVDASNPDSVLGTLDGPMTAMGQTITATITDDITEVKVVDASVTNTLELTDNGDFEAGDVSGWELTTAPLQPGQVFEATTDNPSSGNFAGRLFNPVPTNGLVIKQANIGAGVVNPGDQITVSFDARGLGEAGGVGIAEFFSEIAGGGTSSSEVLGGAPFSIDPSFDFNNWTTFTYTVTAGSDVSGGVTLQFVAATGAAGGSVMNLFIDNVSVTVESMCMGEVVEVIPPSCPGANVEFCVDVSCQDVGPGDEVRVFGSFEPFATPPPPGFFNPFFFEALEEDPMQPGKYCGTFFVTATPALEYKFIITNGSQTVNEEQFAPDEPCTTTPFGFTNRVLEVVDGQDAAVSFGWLSCDENCLQLPSLPIDFEGEGVLQYSILDFGGAVTNIGPDPEDADNTVACTEKTQGAETFAGAIVPFIGLDDPIMFVGDAPVITVDVNAPAAGIPVLLKIEDSDSSNPPANPATVFAEVLATTTTAGWQTLVFNFNESTNQPFNMNIDYDRFVIFFDFGNVGDGTTYCFDNIQAVPLFELACNDATVSLDAEGEASLSAADLYDVTTLPDCISPEFSQLEFGCDDVGTVQVTGTINDLI